MQNFSESFKSIWHNDYLYPSLCNCFTPVRSVLEGVGITVIRIKLSKSRINCYGYTFAYISSLVIIIMQSYNCTVKFDIIIIPIRLDKPWYNNYTECLKKSFPHLNSNNSVNVRSCKKISLDVLECLSV